MRWPYFYLCTCCLVIVGGLLPINFANATVIFYHDRTAFLAGLSGQVITTDGYESYPMGNLATGDRRGDFLYQFDASAVQPAIVSDGAIGTALGGAPFDVFVAGDAVTLNFQSLPAGTNRSLLAFGADFAYAPSGPDIPPDIYRLSIADGAAAGMSVGNDAGLDTNGGTFFLGVIGDSASLFQTLSLFSIQTDPNFLVPAYLVDDLVYVAVPEPATQWLFLLGLFVTVLMLRRPAARFKKNSNIAQLPLAQMFC